MISNQELSMEECKEIQLEIVRQIDKICKEIGLSYSLGFGTLLGAIRHKGFIPWDDDIDLLMKRDDFEKLKRYFEVQHMPNLYKLDYDNAFFNIIKICDAHTRVVCQRNIHIPDYGVWVDIFPIDEVPAPGTKESIIAKKKYRFVRKLTVTRALKWEHAKTLSGIKKIGFYGLKLLLQVFPYTFFSKKLNKLVQKYNGKNTGYFGCYMKYTKPGRSKDEFRSEVFSEFVDIEFEGLKLKTIKNYDEYLKLIYGDYMKLPPESERVGHENRAFRV